MPAPSAFDDLRNRFNAGEVFKFLHFWGHQPSRDGSITQTCMSQWFEAAFEVDGRRYMTAEHFMMAEKARLFGDQAALERILDATNPGAAKALGRQVSGFVEDVWVEHRFQIVCRANTAKFGQNPALREFLIRTGDKIPVEASPTDRVWGIGMAANDPDASNPNHWRGGNLLGFALMRVRQTL
jgi:ribA/ribD-fused uncharacterized protein